MVSNWCRCTSCHAGYGWRDAGFGFTPEKIDCLVCHDTTGTYHKFPTDCGYPPLEDKVFAGKKKFRAVDLSYVARHVGRSTRESCGKCHFYSGGGDGVKRGDLDSLLVSPPKELDVHMDARGLNFSCTTCHREVAHEIEGRHYDQPAPGERRMALPRDRGHRVRCESCHGARPHWTRRRPFALHLVKLDDHTRRLACQTCHIPFYARGRPTNTYWDWSTAGRFRDGKPVVEKGPLGRPVYHTKKGTLAWGRNLVPRYMWFDGTMSYLLAGEPLRRDEEGRVVLIAPNGRPDQPEARIHPFKPHYGRQPYDPVRGTMVVPKLFGPKGSGAFWAEFDWTRAVAAGMEAADLPFSGQVGFVETVHYLPLHHTVAPKEEALRCVACHVREGGRMSGVEGVYVPARDSFAGVDRLGRLLCLLALAGVGLHGAARVALHLSGRGRRAEGEER